MIEKFHTRKYHPLCQDKWPREIPNLRACLQEPDLSGRLRLLGFNSPCSRPGDYPSAVIGFPTARFPDAETRDETSRRPHRGMI